jgi:hypothetical protein
MPTLGHAQGFSKKLRERRASAGVKWPVDSPARNADTPFPGAAPIRHAARGYEVTFFVTPTPRQHNKKATHKAWLFGFGGQAGTDRDLRSGFMEHVFWLE